MSSSPYTVDELERIVERLDPSRLLFVRPETELNGASQGLLVDLSHTSLQDYADERSGLIDLICEAKIFDQATLIELSIDEAALAAAEDARLGPSFPRRGRPGAT
jgi:hypothetical protein